MNYKRIKAKLLFKFKYGFKFGLKVFGILVGICTTVFAFIDISGGKVEQQYVLCLLGLITLISLIVILIKGHVDHLPDTIVFDNDSDLKYELTYENKEVCEYFNEDTAKYFGRDFVDDIIVESWRSQNPNGFLFLKNQNNEPCAALALLALEPSFMDQFIKGRVSESDLEKEDVLNLDASKKSCTLYLVTLIVSQPQSRIGNRRALAIVWGLIQYIKRIYGIKKKRTIYAVPVNTSSENLLKRFGFQKVGFARERKDKHDLYALGINRNTINMAIQRIGDYSNICSLNI